MRKIGLALSGGGARGIAHLGVIKALQEMGLKPSVISGTSAGAIVGTFYAAGYQPEEILAFLKQTNIYSVLRLAMSRVGILKMASAEKIYRKYLKHETFEDLDIPMHIAATDILSGKVIYFCEGPLMQPLMASSSIPVMFEPIKYQGMVLLDGGILNNLPVEPLLGRCEFIIGVNTNPVVPATDPGTFRKVMERSFLLTVSNTINSRRAQCDIFLEPPTLSEFGIFDVSKGERIFEIGYKFAMERANEILSLSKRNSPSDLY